VASLFDNAAANMRGPETNNKYLVAQSESQHAADESRRQGLADTMDSYDKVLKRVTDYVSCVSVTVVPSSSSSPLEPLQFVHVAWMGSDSHSTRFESNLVPIKGLNSKCDDPDVKKCQDQKATVGSGELFGTLCTPILGADGSVIGVLKCEGKFSKGHIGLAFNSADCRLLELAAMSQAIAKPATKQVPGFDSGSVKKNQVAPAPVQPEHAPEAVVSIPPEQKLVDA